ncbi:MAG: glycosyltransferase family 1 protein [Alistipes sp.]|nr:glycosyltransferase family 1 protein [Alistipes sp.]
MKIAIEAQRIFRPNKHGMDFVALETVRYLQKIDHENEYFILTAPGEDRCIEASENFHILTLNASSYPIWEQILLPRALAKIKPDLLHCTSNTAPIRCPVPLVLTLHDIIFLEKRSHSSSSWYQNLGWYYRRLVVPRILPQCRKIITVSHFEAQRIGEALQIGSDRLTAIYNGYGEHFRPVDNPYSVTQKYLPERDYIFFLGNTDPKKNTERTLQAYGLYVAQTSHPLPLLIADLPEAVADTILKTHGLESIRPLLRFPGYIPNRDLPALYSGARLFLYPSLRESFGIPMLEAMACGTPLITSNTSAMPEVAGEGALLVDPFSEQSIAQALIRLTEDASLHEQQRVYGLQRVKAFSWQHTAEQTLAVYQSLLAHK